MVSRRGVVMALGLLFGVAPAGLAAQGSGGARCFELDIDDPSALFMLERDLQGEILVLTDEPLEGSPSVTDGARAYIGRETWRTKEPLRPSSWYWNRTASDSIRIGLVLPLWAITWIASDAPDGLVGEVIYHSDAVDEPQRTSAFRGRPVTCASQPRG